MPEKWTGRLVGKMHNNQITREALAKELGWTKSYVSMILNGLRSPANGRQRLEQAVDKIIAARSQNKQ